jgi:hypothetical protein
VKISTQKLGERRSPTPKVGGAAADPAPLVPSVFLKVGTVFGIGIAKYRGIGIGIFNPYKTY